jgi:hypothetical protein
VPEQLEALQHRKADLEAAVADVEPGSEDHGRLCEELDEIDRQIAAATAAEAATIDVTAVEDDEEPEAPAGKDLVVADPTDRHEVFVVLDRHDEDLIVAEMQRRLTKTLLYDFPQDGSRVVDLSVYGVRECVRLLNNTGRCKIRVDADHVAFEEVHEDGQEWVVATAYAVDDNTGYGVFGTAAQPKRLKLKEHTARKKREKGDHVAEDNTVWDKFARAKALSKAQRNALAAHIPEGLRQTLIAQYKGDADAIRHIAAGPGAEQLAELPPPLNDERAEELKAKARAVFQQLRDADPLKVLPAQFHANLTRAEHSHDRLEDFIAYLEGKLAEAGGVAA